MVHQLVILSHYSRSELQDVTVKAINKILICSDRMLQILSDNIEMVIADDNSVEMEKLNGILKRKKAKELVKACSCYENYAALADEIDILRDKKHFRTKSRNGRCEKNE